MNGSKIMVMNVPAFKIRFPDSINFIQFPLSLFPKTFGLKEFKKGFFPHLFNKPGNENYVEKIPNEIYFSAETMKPSVLKEFLAWYKEREKTEWNFANKLREYCRSDVDILRRSMKKFREDFLELENVDPLQYSTNAAVCMAIFRVNY